MNSRHGFLWIALLVSGAACEAEHDLGNECIALSPDASATELNAGGAAPAACSSGSDAAVTGSPGAFIDAEAVGCDAGPGASFVGRPLGGPSLGRLAGCDEPVAPTCDAQTGAGCANPFYSGPSGLDEETVQEVYGPCACILDGGR